MSDILDLEQRRQALDPRDSFIVQAPAGSGKTELLTQRFLRLLARVDKPEEIVAITFTRKAAAEMRNRILGALDSASGPRPGEAHKQQTWDLAHAALAREQHCGWQLRHSPNRLRILTFDSLCASLARQLPLLSQLGAPAGTREDATALYQKAARTTLQRLSDPDLRASLSTVLRHLDNQLGQLEDLLVQMLGRRDQWLPHLLRNQDVDRLEQTLRKLVEEHLGILDPHFSASQMSELVRLAGFAADHLPLNTQTDPRFVSLLQWRERRFRPDTCWEELGLWQGLAKLVLTDNGAPRKRLDKNIGFPPDQKQAKAEMAGLIAELNQDPVLTELLDATRRLPDVHFSPGQRALLEALRQVLLDASAQLQLVFQEHAEIDFVEVQARALHALGQPDDPGELALLMDYRIRHLLVDEFQDTSIGQYQLLERLTGGWQPGDGRTLFVVGDPMQSIYRFRKAEVGLFLQACQEGLGNIPLTPLRLQMNFRSQENIVEWINECFVRLFPEEVDITLGAMPYAASVACKPPDPDDAVQIHGFAQRNDAQEAAQVVDLVQRRLADPCQGDIAILARARSHLHSIAGALLEAGIRFQAVKVDPLASRPTVRDLHSLTRALLHPADRLAWLSLLRSPLIGMDASDLARLCEGARDTAIWALIDQDTRVDRLSKDGRQRLQRLKVILASELPARYRRPLRDWIEAIWLSLGGAVIGANDDAQAYLALLASQEQHRVLTDFGAFEQALQQLFAPPDSAADPRVQLMTMHQAKGLEFDTVILPGLGRAPTRDRSELLYWLELADQRDEASLLMAPIKGGQQDKEPISEYIRWINQRKQDLEDLRLLYVAATRARRQLHLFGHVTFDKKGQCTAPSGSLLARLWPSVQDTLSHLAPPGKDAATGARYARPREEQRIAADWHPDIGPSSPLASVPLPAANIGIDFEWAGDSARHIGTLTHRYLERIGNEGLAAWPAQRIGQQRAAVHAGLATLGVAPDSLDSACDTVLRALRQTLQHKQGQWILAKHEQAACELPLTLLGDDGEPHQYVIDRTFVEDGIRWIIDYKTGEHLGSDVEAFLDQEQERYREQLENYARILRLMEKRPIRLALYFPLLQALRAWDAPS